MLFIKSDTLILIEIISLVLVLMLSSQRSRLWSSLIIIPSGFSFILLRVGFRDFSGFIVVIYSIIFIGGLLVLLVRVASISYQEQGFSVRNFVVMGRLIICLPFLLEYQVLENRRSVLLRVKWFDYQREVLLLLLLILLVALLLISRNISLFKGLIRII